MRKNVTFFKHKQFLKPKTSCKTSCFFLNNAMFCDVFLKKKYWRQCFWQCSSKRKKNVQMMHLRMLIAHPYAAAVTAVTIFPIITIIIVVIDIKHLKHVPTQKSYLYYRCIYITDVFILQMVQVRCILYFRWCQSDVTIFQVVQLQLVNLRLRERLRWRKVEQRDCQGAPGQLLHWNFWPRIKMFEKVLNFWPGMKRFKKSTQISDLECKCLKKNWQFLTLDKIFWKVLHWTMLLLLKQLTNSQTKNQLSQSAGAGGYQLEVLNVHWALLCLCKLYELICDTWFS